MRIFIDIFGLLSAVSMIVVYLISGKPMSSSMALMGWITSTLLWGILLANTLMDRRFSKYLNILKTLNQEPHECKCKKE